MRAASAFLVNFLRHTGQDERLDVGLCVHSGHGIPPLAIIPYESKAFLKRKIPPRPPFSKGGRSGPPTYVPEHL